MNSFPAKYTSQCRICRDQISLYEPITRWDTGYVHWRCTRGVKKPRRTPRPLEPVQTSDVLKLAREQYARYKVGDP